MSEAINQNSDYVTVTVAKQLFGIPVLTVQDILGPQRITRIPLAPPEVAGALNLRGRIVTAIDVRSRLGLPPRKPGDEGMAVVVEHDQELYSLLIDSVGDVLSLPASTFERNPTTMDALWREVSVGIHRLKDELMMVLDVDRLLNIDKALAA
ncbi:MAG: chemotaxis protein CheW [Alphaproteobacteria bacterium]